MTKAMNPGVGQGKGGGRPRREGDVVQVRLNLPGDVYQDLMGRSNREKRPMWEIVARLTEGEPVIQTDPVAVPGVPDGGITNASILSETKRLTRPNLGLCFVPDLALALLQHATLPEVHKALLKAVQGRMLELRPESGLDRLSAAELALCPPGPQGTRLSWCRAIPSC